jgi:O-antigen/teichoic acid export membrane protein
MKKPTLNDFVIRVGGVAVLILVIILTFNEFAPSYAGIAVFVTSVLGVFFAALFEYKAKKKRKLKKTKKRKR